MTKHNKRTSKADIDRLRLFCQLGKDALFNLLRGHYGFTIINDGTKWRHAYRQGAVSVLGVAHADTVLDSTAFTYDGRDKVVSPELDDRLGLWTLLHGLPSHGVNDFSILVTDFEEIGQSTASEFDPPVDFNWMFQFDRRGTGVVNYEFGDDGVFDGLLKQTFGKLHRGSFSDICSLSGLGCKGFNVGTAYYNEHTHGCWANLKELRNQMRNFSRFFHSFKGWKLPHAQRRYTAKTTTVSGYGPASVSKSTKKSQTKTVKQDMSLTTASLRGFQHVAPLSGSDVECGSCLLTFDALDCLQLKDGQYLCSDCADFFKSDLKEYDLLDNPMDDCDWPDFGA